MSINLTYFLIFLTIGLAVLLPFGLLKYRLREKYIEEVLQKLPEGRRNRMYALNKRIITLSNILFWMAPLALIVIPYPLFTFFGINSFLAISFVVLIYITLVIEYLYSRSKIFFLQGTEDLDEQAGKNNKHS